VLVFHDFFIELMMIDFKTLNIMFIYLLVYPAIQMFQIKNQVKYNYKPIVFVTLSNALISSIASIVLTLIFVNKLNGKIIGYFTPMIIISFVVYIYLMFEGKSINKKYWSYALKISFPLILHLLAGYLLSSVDKIMITKMVSSHANALYSVAYTISQVIAILWMSMNNAWSPWAYEKMDNKEYDSLFKNSKPYLIFFLIVVFLFMLVAPELLLIMGGNEYLETKYVIPPVMIGYVFQFVYSLYVNIEFYHKKQKNIAFGTIIACVINIILNYILIPRFGYIAAAYTTLIGYISLYVIHYIFVKKLGCTSWYDNRFFLKMLIISLFSLLVSNLLFKFNIIRYFIIGLIAIGFIIFLVRKRDKIITAIKNKSLMEIKDIIFSS
jgi:O-antigen/teichoic acid export membrane protein